MTAERFTTKELASNEYVGNFLLTVITALGEENRDKLDIKPGGEFTVELKINGKDVPVRPFVEKIFGQFNRMRAEIVSAEIGARVKDLTRRFDRLTSNVEKAMLTEFPEYKEEEE